MKISVYTSCSANYLPKARVLASSLKKFHPSASITLLLADEVPYFDERGTSVFDRVWRPKDLGYSDSWIFKHNIMEICTAVKGRALKRILEEDDADLYLYFDPDVCVYNPLDALLHYMGESEIGLVPHITKPEDTDVGVRVTEVSVALHGTYNLGHLIIRKGASSTAFASWWASRLDQFCYDDKDYGLFTDQRWCDLAPALFDRVGILRQPNIDVASWNVYGREFQQSDPADMCSITVNGMPLLTYHFSGTGPTGTHKRVREIFAPADPVVAEIERLYEDEIGKQGQALLAELPYGGDFFDDGTKISQQARLLYRRHADLSVSFPNPYNSGDGSYLKWLREQRQSAVNGIRLRPEQIARGFDSLFDEEFYIGQYPEVSVQVKSGKVTSAREHYVKYGSRMLYDPSRYFVSSYYYNQICRGFGTNPELNSVDITGTLLWHYLTVGLENGIEPVDGFDSGWYIRQYPDLAEALTEGRISCPLEHFAVHGDTERRRPSEKFDPGLFLAHSARANELVASGAARGPLAAKILLGHVTGSS
ncbi:hypothetical protein C6558_37875 [Ensifer sp. NM-2]|uniref:hypothetical protein n=1 Tax=Ensifer sp. NM-2 TaxID=2109730 RepID=UPI000D11DF3C|nr:hypothetical protein [Ensifer sp. NM-2]PSS59504.1 hypothetical protein C6558_37875 [Ensifer sp. NM-2]